MGASCPETTFKNSTKVKEFSSSNDKSDPGQSRFEDKNRYTALDVTDYEESSTENKLLAGVVPSSGTEWQQSAEGKKKNIIVIEINVVEHVEEIDRVMGKENYC